MRLTAFLGMIGLILAQNIQKASLVTKPYNGNNTSEYNGTQAESNVSLDNAPVVDLQENIRYMSCSILSWERVLSRTSTSPDCPLIYSLDRRPRTNDWPETSCHFLENFAAVRPLRAPVTTIIRPLPSPPAPISPHKSLDGVPELVPIPCKPCDKDRKDRLFIRGSPFSSSMTKLLVDYAGAQSGGKILAHSDGIRGASDVLHTDDNRYLLTPCSNKVWMTFRLSDEIFIEKIGIVSNELFASTFRHIQILGSRQYPTNEWRVLGEIETNPMENQEWFDLSGSSQCSKCYVKFLKIRVLTHHALEGYTNCALTRIQVFGSTVLQSLDRIQAMNSSVTETGTSNAHIPAFVKLANRGLALMESRIESLISGHDASPSVSLPINGEESGETLNSTPSPDTTSQHRPSSEPDSNPLLNLIEEMAQLKKQYNSVVGTLYALNQNKGQSSGSLDKSASGLSSNVTTMSDTIHISVLGMSLTIQRPVFPEPLTLLIASLLVSQIVSFFLLYRRRPVGSPPIDKPVAPSSLLVSLNHPPLNRRYSQRLATPQTVAFKKRSHGLWRPKARRVLYQHHVLSKKSSDSMDSDPSMTEERGSPNTIGNRSSPDVLSKKGSDSMDSDPSINEERGSPDTIGNRSSPAASFSLDNPSPSLGDPVPIEPDALRN